MRPISSHLDQTSLVNNAYLSYMKNKKKKRTKDKIQPRHTVHVYTCIKFDAGNISVNTRTYQFWSVVSESGAVSQQLSR